MDICRNINMGEVPNCISAEYLNTLFLILVVPANRSFKIDHAGGSDIVAIDMSCTGKFMMSCSAKTDVVLYDLNGTTLSKLDTVLGKNFWAKISPDGKLLASSGFTPDVKASNSTTC